MTQAGCCYEERMQRLTVFHAGNRGRSDVSKKDLLKCHLLGETCTLREVDTKQKNHRSKHVYASSL